ncbi:MAG: protein-glutamate O-methyltransferase CheR [Pseudolabrys sp.]
MTPQDFDYLRALLKERSGLVLSADKQYLAESRLLPLARRNDLANLGDLVTRLRGKGVEALTVAVVEAMTTNESFFFRDKLPFDHFRNVILPELIAQHYRRHRIRIWCTAAATGQEPYSLAMILRDMADKLAGWRVDILATDIASEILEKAKTGIYSQFEVQRGLPIQDLVKSFTQVGDHWQIKPELRQMVTFRQLNLLHDFSHLGFFDVVFCRNVLIYFDQPTKADVLKRMAHVIEPTGYLVLGAAETVVGLTDAFKPHSQHRGLYVPQAARQPGEAAPKPATPAKVVHLAAATR